MAYVTFGRDMRSAGRKAGKAIRGMGNVVMQNMGDPFSLAWPLGQGVAIVLLCGVKMAGYVLRKICD